MNNLKKKAAIEFSVTFLVVIVVFALSVIKTREYNRAEHEANFSGPALLGMNSRTATSP